jgi:exo-1,4-beta-D-glucosaminidase
VRAFELPTVEGLTPTYFVRLRLDDRSGREISTNFYWLSTREDVLDWSSKEWFYTRTTRHADLTALAKLPATTLQVAADSGSGGPDAQATVTVANTGNALAFQVHLEILDGEGHEILPAFWDDNYFALLPGEKRVVTVTYSAGVANSRPAVVADAWNAAQVRR